MCGKRSDQRFPAYCDVLVKGDCVRYVGGSTLDAVIV